MDVLGDLVARPRRSDAPAFRHAPSGRAYDYHRFCTTAWKVGNLLRNEGVRDGATVVVTPDPDPEPVLALFGSALLGATARVGGSATEAKALVVATDRVDDHDAGVGTRRVAYGDPPEDPAVSYFEQDVWSENPTEPPDVVDPDAPILAAGDRTYTHADLLAAGRRVAAEWDLAVDESVAVRSSLARPGTVAAGVLAPLLAGGEVVIPDDGTTGDFAVADGDAPETSVAPDDVLG